MAATGAAQKRESEAAVLNLGKQLGSGEISQQAYEVQKAEVWANLQQETSRLDRLMSLTHTGANIESASAKNAEMLRKAGDDRRAALCAPPI